ncbi:MULTISPECIES: hypothetical protein [Bradyrhizobium]|uniref:Uncharacterized protein n=1 Tax=Bradyrhizobium diazoefficiens TaxID=1355477 RepID=A0A0E3VT17_9BRAD|nr:hypothetical protein [Bradyrhizobium diazoefficiens]WLC21214.1 hypothetical protein QIH76_07355 [Bradyrhizobium diazoefficiens]BAR54880.1 hypothetical protein NK6_1696 [Bradyrhizobium diazoefficiens]
MAAEVMAASMAQAKNPLIVVPSLCGPLGAADYHGGKLDISE